MIIQVWHGITLLSNAEKYQALMNENILPFYQCASGNLGVYLCREVTDQVGNFLLLSLWSSREALIRFTGSDVVEAVAHSEAEKKLLLAFEAKARNYEVCLMPESMNGE